MEHWDEVYIEPGNVQSWQWAGKSFQCMQLRRSRQCYRIGSEGHLWLTSLAVMCDSISGNRDTGTSITCSSRVQVLLHRDVYLSNGNVALIARFSHGMLEWMRDAGEVGDAVHEALWMGCK